MKLLAILLPWLLYVPLLISQNSKPPNILLILVDDMGNSDASFNYRITNRKTKQSPPILTPNMDYLAENGIIFANHYTNMICGPTRSALIASRFAYKIGNPFPIRKKGHMSPKYHTFAHELQSRGYRNHFIGKYGIDDGDREWDIKLNKYTPSTSEMNKKLGPLSRGFNTFYGLYNSGHNHFTKKVIGVILDWHKFNETHLLEAPDTLDPEVDKSSTYLFVRETINVIKQDTANNQPWFIHLSFTMPHDPMQVDPHYITDFAHCAKMKGWRRRVYCGMVTCVDEGIGNITNYLRDNNLLDNTVVIFSSDNGGFPNVGGFNYPYRGMKISPYEGGVKTIGFIYGKYIFPKTNGKIFYNNIHIVDWGPTLLSIVDEAMNKPYKHKMGNIDGLDFRYTLQNFIDDDNTDKQLLNRNEFIVEARWWNNLTVYRYNEYKLFVGTQNYDQLFIEPDDVYNLNTNDRNKVENYDWIITDYINYFIYNVLGVDYFWFEWNVSILGRMIWLRILKPSGCPNSPMPPSSDSKPANKLTFHWPFIDNKDAKCQRVRLYDLKNDPTESNNLAYKPQYKETVNMMMDRLIKKLKHEYESGQIEDDVSSDGLLPLVNETQARLRIVGVITIIVIVCVTLLICWKCCACCCRNKQKKRKTA